VTFRRLTPGHVIAFVGALALLFAMAVDWYTDKVGEQDRFYQHQIVPQLNRDLSPSPSQMQAYAAEAHEKNAWQASAAIDRFILFLLLATVALALFAAFARAAGRSLGPPSPSAIATLTGLFATLLVIYRIVHPPGFADAVVVKPGAWLGVACAALVAFGSRLATLMERERPAAAEAPPPDADAPETPATPAGAG
jgi:hypothetical protein